MMEEKRCWSCVFDNWDENFYGAPLWYGHLNKYQRVKRYVCFFVFYFIYFFVLYRRDLAINNVGLPRSLFPFASLSLIGELHEIGLLCSAVRTRHTALFSISIDPYLFLLFHLSLYLEEEVEVLMTFSLCMCCRVSEHLVNRF